MSLFPDFYFLNFANNRVINPAKKWKNKSMINLFDINNSFNFVNIDVIKTDLILFVLFIMTKTKLIVCREYNL